LILKGKILKRYFLLTNQITHPLEFCPQTNILLCDSNIMECCKVGV